MPQKFSNLTTIIVLNWKNYLTTKGCLESLRKVKYPNFEVVVVDNGSQDNSVKLIKKNFPEVVLIEVGENLGYAAGNNLGIDHALESGANYIVILNNDIIVTPNFLKELVKIAESGKDVGVVSPKMYYPRSKTFYSAGGFIDWSTGTGHHRGHMQEDRGQFDDNAELDFAPGAALLLKAKVIEKVGKIPEDFFLMAEDLDWSTSIKEAGYKILFAPKSVVYHLESFSFKTYHKGLKRLGMWSPTKYYYFARSIPRFVEKHRSGKDWYRFLFNHYILLAKLAFQELKAKEFGNILAMLEGHLDFWLGKKGRWK